MWPGYLLWPSMCLSPTSALPPSPTWRLSQRGPPSSLLHFGTATNKISRLRAFVLERALPHVTNASRHQELLPPSLNNNTIVITLPTTHHKGTHTVKMATPSKMSRANNMQLFHMLPKNGLYYEFWVSLHSVCYALRTAPPNDSFDRMKRMRRTRPALFAASFPQSCPPRS